MICLVEFQVRLGLLRDGQNEATGGTVFKAIAMQGDGMNTIQIELNKANRIDFYINRVIFEIPPDLARLDLDGVVVLIGDDDYMFKFSNGIQVKVQMTPHHDALSVLTDVPHRLAGKTSGLLGSMDNNTSNDFELPSGEVLNISPANDRVIFEQFGRAWQVDQQSSIFTYQEGTDFFTFSDALYIPNFVSDGIQFKDSDQEKMARAACGENQRCLFDISATGDVAVGQLSVKFEEEVKNFSTK
jgi:hypothetical protein